MSNKMKCYKCGSEDTKFIEKRKEDVKGGDIIYKDMTIEIYNCKSCGVKFFYTPYQYNTVREEIQS